ncbi:hypothetical protein DITRI_Ditri10aG0051100 [Diplodiscus trichospermus]
MDHQSDSRFGVLGRQITSPSSTTMNQERDHSSIPVQGIKKQQQQHLNFPQTSFALYGSSNYHPYTGSSGNTSALSPKLQPHDSQIRQNALQQNEGSNPLRGSTLATNMITRPKLERQNSTNNPNRLQGGSLSHYSSS